VAIEAVLAGVAPELAGDELVDGAEVVAFGLFAAGSSHAVAKTTAATIVSVKSFICSSLL